jgi:hypothetical protein
MAMGIGVALAAAPGRGGAATPAGVNKAGADAQVQKAKALYDQARAAEDSNNNGEAQRLYAQAQAENEKALALDPSNETALLLKKVIVAKMSAAPETGTTTKATGPAGRVPLLTAQQVSMIRLIELSPDDARITGRVDPKILEDFWQNVVKADTTNDTSKATHDRFVNPQNFPIQARRIRDDNEQKYMEGVTITSDPATIATFKTSVLTYTLQSCATSDCHGGDKAGNFKLINPATSAEQVYTDYYILTMYSNADGAMIDRQNSNNSLLVQYGLPWANAKIKHPKVDVRKLTGPNDARLVKIQAWMQNLGLTRPNYHISYEVPGVVPASAPASATAPATAAGTPAAK